MFFKEKAQDGTLTNRQRNVIKNILRILVGILRTTKNI